MKKSILAAFLVCASPLLGFAADASARPDIDELFTVMRVEESMNSAMEQMKQAMPRITSAAMQQANVSGAEQATKIQIKVMTMVQEELAWTKLKPEMVQIYAEAFTPAETKDLIAFYKSPAGQNFLNKQPELMKKTMALTQGKVMAMMPKIKSVIQSETKAEPQKKAEAPEK